MGLAFCKNGHLIFSDSFNERGRCRECIAEERKRYYAANKGKENEAGKRYRAANKEKEAARIKRYRATNKEKVADTEKRWRAANKEKIAEKFKKWCAANKERRDANQKRYRATNKEKVRYWRKKSRVEISDHYTRSLLGVKKGEVPKELIELKRLQITLIREIKSGLSQNH